VDGVVAALDARAVLFGLSPVHRAVLVHLYLLDLTIEETAVVLHIPVGTVKSRAHNALRAARRVMDLRRAATRRSAGRAGPGRARPGRPPGTPEPSHRGAEPAGHGLRPVPHAQLRVDVIDVIAHGLLAQVEIVGDVAVGGPAHDVGHDLDLTL